MNTESDPSGKSPHEPGAKLDAGKMLPWLCISGFARLLAALERVRNTIIVDGEPPEKLRDGIAQRVADVSPPQRKGELTWALMPAST